MPINYKLKAETNRLFIILDSPQQKGGIEVFNDDLIKVLKERFSAIRIIYIHAPSFRITKKYVALNKFFWFFLKKFIISLLVRKRDVLIFHQPGHLKYHLRNTTKTILFVHNPSEIQKFKVLEVLNKIQVICVADHIISYLKSFPQNKIKVTPPIHRFVSLKPRDLYLYRFVYIGRFSAEKKLQESIEFIKKIASENKTKEISFDLIGEGIESQNLSQIIKNSRIDNLKISIKPWVSRERLYDLFNNYDFYISSSKIEGMPIGLREAMNAGLIPVASDIPAHNEIIEESYNGYIINQDFNVSDFMKSTSEIEKRKQIINNIKLSLSNHYFENFKDSINGIFKNILPKSTS